MSPAEHELRGLYPLRLVLPTAGDLAEMATALQERREGALRRLDGEEAGALGGRSTRCTGGLRRRSGTC